MRTSLCSLVVATLLVATASASAAPFVGVDDDWGGSTVGQSVTAPDGASLTIGTNAFGTIAEAIAAVDSGGTIQVYAGT